MKNGEETANHLHIQPLNDDLLANLSIEELEGRLEMQILQLTEAQFCYDCGGNCAQEGCALCECHCVDSCCTECSVLCGGECSGLCASECTPFSPAPGMEGLRG